LAVIEGDSVNELHEGAITHIIFLERLSKRDVLVGILVPLKCEELGPEEESGRVQLKLKDLEHQLFHGQDLRKSVSIVDRLFEHF